MKNLPGRIEAISDVESISQVGNSDNIYTMNFELYVRWKKMEEKFINYYYGK